MNHFLGIRDTHLSGKVPTRHWNRHLALACWACTSALHLPSGAAPPLASETSTTQTQLPTDTPTPVRLTVETGREDYAADEFLSDGRVFNRESGVLKPVRFLLEGSHNAWTLRASLHHASGVIDYNGQTQLAIPLKTRTELSRRGAGLRLGRVLALGEGAPSLTVFGGAQWLRTTRDIQSTPFSSQLTETLRTREWTLGAEAVASGVVQQRPVRLTAGLQLNRPWSHTLAVDAHGAIDPVELYPAARWGHQVDLSLVWSATADVDVSLTASWETYRPGASISRTVFRNGIPVGAASYPGSVQKIRQILLGLAWRL